MMFWFEPISEEQEFKEIMTEIKISFFMIQIFNLWMNLSIDFDFL